MEFLKGKKTILTMVAVAILAIVSLVFSVVMPDWAWTILAGLGFGFFRAAITHLSKNTGWKTYVAVASFIALGGLQAFVVTIPPDILTAIYGILGSFGVVGVRDALAEVPKT